MEEIKTPNKIFFEKLEGDKGTLIISPCYPGYGTTIANSLRRVLLSSLPGSAITSINVKGVDHEFSTIDGVKEDFIDIILNLKQARVKVFSDEPVKLNFKGKVKKQLTLGDFKAGSDVEIVNKDLKIATVSDSGIELEIEATAQKGRGYEAVESREKDSLTVGAIAIDAAYTPVKRVSYKVESVRVGQRTDFDKIEMEVITDGSISPKEAVEQAAKILVEQFSSVSKISEDSKTEGLEISSEVSDVVTSKKQKEKVETTGDLIEETKFSTRTMNALHASGLKTLQEVAERSEPELLAIDGVGKTSIDEIRKALKKKSLNLKDDAA